METSEGRSGLHDSTDRVSAYCKEALCGFGFLGLRPSVDIDRALKSYHLYENTHYDATCPQYLAWGKKR